VLEIAREGIVYSGFQIPSLGFSKDLAKRLNPGKSSSSRKGRDKGGAAFDPPQIGAADNLVALRILNIIAFAGIAEIDAQGRIAFGGTEACGPAK
jgi:hypothetical protein